jgi:preprotein translocase subunit SecG
MITKRFEYEIFFISGQLVLGIMILSSVSVLTSILILYLYHKGTSTQVPEKIKTIFFRGLATAMCMRAHMPDGSHSQVVPTEKDTEKANANKNAWPLDVDDGPPILADHDLQKLANDLSYIAQRAKKQDKDQEIVEEWRNVARVLDRFLFWVSTVLVVIILFVFLMRRDPSYH